MKNAIFSVTFAAHAGLLPARAAALSPKEQRTARDLYDIKCAKCHKFYDPSQYSQREWDLWMRRMSRKSKLKPTQERLLSQYLQTFRDNAAGSGPRR